MVPTLIATTLLTFLAVHVAPGDPVSAMLGTDGEAEMDTEALATRRAAIEHRYGFDRSFAVQYLNFLGPFNLLDDGHPWFGGDGRQPYGGLFALDLREEIQRPGLSIASEIRRRLSVTVPVALSSLLLTLVIGIPLGVYGALRRGRVSDRLVTLLSFAIFATPGFLGAILLVLSFGETGLGWLPVIGIADVDAREYSDKERLLDWGRHAVLPVIALSYANAAYLARHVRASMSDALASPAVRTARAMGLSEVSVVGKHALRQALLPAITVLGGMIPLVIGGSVVIETVFELPGVGRYGFEGFLRRDVHVILSTTALGAILTLIGMLVTDLAYVAADPRIDLRARWEGRGG